MDNQYALAIVVLFLVLLAILPGPLLSRPGPLLSRQCAVIQVERRHSSPISGALSDSFAGIAKALAPPSPRVALELFRLDSAVRCGDGARLWDVTRD
jgi:hypothetical protein